MQKTKKVAKTASARQPAIRSARTVSKPAQKSTVKSRKRKPLTPEQRARKNAHDRAVRAAKRAAAIARGKHCTESVRKHDRRPGLQAGDPNTPCRTGRVSCSDGVGAVGSCTHCSPECHNYEKCKSMARTDKFPRLHAVKPGLVPVEKKTDEPRQAESVRRELSPLQAIGAWVQENLARLEQTKASGIARQIFSIPGGVAEVSVCRKVCEIPPADQRFGELVGTMRRTMLRPEQLFTPDVLAGFRRIWDSYASRSRYVPFDFGDEIVRDHSRRGLTWEGEAPDPQ